MFSPDESSRPNWLNFRVDFNPEMNGVEIRFAVKPDPDDPQWIAIKQRLSDHNFKFTGYNGDACWYARNTPVSSQFALELANQYRMPSEWTGKGYEEVQRALAEKRAQGKVTPFNRRNSKKRYTRPPADTSGVFHSKTTADVSAVKSLPPDPPKPAPTVPSADLSGWMAAISSNANSLLSVAEQFIAQHDRSAIIAKARALAEQRCQERAFLTWKVQNLANVEFIYTGLELGLFISMRDEGVLDEKFELRHPQRFVAPAETPAPPVIQPPATQPPVVLPPVIEEVPTAKKTQRADSPRPWKLKTQFKRPEIDGEAVWLDDDELVDTEPYPGCLAFFMNRLGYSWKGLPQPIEVRMTGLTDPYRPQPGTFQPLSASSEYVQRIAALLDIWHEWDRLNAAEKDPNATDAEIEYRRTDLNRAYDCFVANYGTLKQNAGLCYVDRVSDPRLVMLLALESDGQKADIFFQRTHSPLKPLTGKVFETMTVENLHKAVALSQNHFGGQINLFAIAEWFEVTPAEAEEALIESEVVFLEPLLPEGAGHRL